MISTPVADVVEEEVHKRQRAIAAIEKRVGARHRSALGRLPTETLVALVDHMVPLRERSAIEVPSNVVPNTDEIDQAKRDLMVFAINRLHARTACGREVARTALERALEAEKQREAAKARASKPNHDDRAAAV